MSERLMAWKYELLTGRFNIAPENRSENTSESIIGSLFRLLIYNKQYQLESSNSMPDTYTTAVEILAHFLSNWVFSAAC